MALPAILAVTHLHLPGYNAFSKYPVHIQSWPAQTLLHDPTMPNVVV